MAKRDPFDDDSEESITTQSPADDQEEKAEKVSTEPDVNDEDSEQPGESEEKKAERRERRRERGKLREAAEEAQRQLAETQRQLDAERTARIATETTANNLAQWQRWQQQQPQKDPWEQAIENEVTNRRNSLRAEHAELIRTEKYTPAEQQRMLAEWQKTETRLQEIVTGKQLYIRDMQARQNAPAQAEAAATAAAQAQIGARYPDIVQNERAALWMTHRHMQMVQAEGKPNTWETADLAAAETRRAFKMGQRPAPDAVTKARYSGVGGGANGHANGDGSIEMTPKFKRMAEALHPDDKPSVAWKKWAQGPGKKMLAGDG
jgi:hypothetical protein